MTSKRDSRGSDYSRGWGTVSHDLGMLRKAAFLQLVLALCVGLTMGTLTFRETLGPERTAHVTHYAKDAITATVAPKKTPPRYHQLRALFGQRSVGYLVKQWWMRVLGFIGLTFALSGPIVTRYGKRVMTDNVLRGVFLKDARRNGGVGEKLKHFAPWALIAGFAVQLLWHSSYDLARFVEFGWSALLQAFPPLARFLSPDGLGQLGWYGYPVVEGFRPTVDVYEAFVNQTGSTFLWMLTKSMAAGLLAAGSILAVLAFAPRLTRLPAVRSAWRRIRRRFGRTDVKQPLVLSGITLDIEDETEHFLFCGSTGSGKSEAQKAMLQQIRDRGEPAILYDVEGEYVEAFYREGRDHILNPFDERSETWTAWAEGSSEESLTALAASLFPPEGKEGFWHKAGAVLFHCAARLLWENGETSNAALYNMLTIGSLKDLLDVLKSTPAQRLLDPSAGAMPSNLLATVMVQVAPFRMLKRAPARGAEPFSIKKFVQSPGDRWLFLSCREDQREACRPLISMWCDVAAAAILSLPKDLSRKRRIWMSIDELASLQYLPSLEDVLARGRKRGGAAMVGLQSMAQLMNIYGEKSAAAIISQMQTWLVLRTVEPETAEWLERALGKAEIERPQASMSVDASAGREGLSIQRSVQERPIVMASEIMTLPNMEGYLKRPGRRVIEHVKYGYTERQTIAEAFVPLKTRAG